MSNACKGRCQHIHAVRSEDVVEEQNGQVKIVFGGRLLNLGQRTDPPNRQCGVPREREPDEIGDVLLNGGVKYAQQYSDLLPHGENSPGGEGAGYTLCMIGSIAAVL
jgi:hypothetical protein